jgi:hypothetical protein
VPTQALCIIQVAQNRPASPANTFQIVSGEYTVASLKTGASGKQPGVFRLNTATGETWQFVSAIDEHGKLAEFWQQIH